MLDILAQTATGKAQKESKSLFVILCTSVGLNAPEGNMVVVIHKPSPDLQCLLEPAFNRNSL